MSETPSIDAHRTESAKGTGEQEKPEVKGKELGRTVSIASPSDHYGTALKTVQEIDFACQPALADKERKTKPPDLSERVKLLNTAITEDTLKSMSKSERRLLWSEITITHKALSTLDSSASEALGLVLKTIDDFIKTEETLLQEKQKVTASPPESQKTSPLTPEQQQKKAKDGMRGAIYALRNPNTKLELTDDGYTTVKRSRTPFGTVGKSAKSRAAANRLLDDLEKEDPSQIGDVLETLHKNEWFQEVLAFGQNASLVGRYNKIINNRYATQLEALKKISNETKDKTIKEKMNSFITKLEEVKENPTPKNLAAFDDYCREAMLDHAVEQKYITLALDCSRTPSLTRYLTRDQLQEEANKFERDTLRSLPSMTHEGRKKLQDELQTRSKELEDLGVKGAFKKLFSAIKKIEDAYAKEETKKKGRDLTDHAEAVKSRLYDISQKLRTCQNPEKELTELDKLTSMDLENISEDGKTDLIKRLEAIKNPDSVPIAFFNSVERTCSRLIEKIRGSKKNTSS
jgi:hypothetical protein